MQSRFRFCKHGQHSLLQPRSGSDSRVFEVNDRVEPLGMSRASAGWGRTCWNSVGLRTRDCKDLSRLLAMLTREKREA